MYRKVSLSSFRSGKVEYCTTSGSGDIEENANPVFFTQTLFTYFGGIEEQTKKQTDTYRSTLEEFSYSLMLFICRIFAIFLFAHFVLQKNVILFVLRSIFFARII